MGIVYKITNKTNNKAYIGQTVRTLDQRWRAHQSAARQSSKFRFHSAIRKYGIDNWDLEILFEDDNIEICKIQEAMFIQKYNTMIYGYNAKPGGCGGWIVPPEKYDTWRKKLSLVNAGAKNNNTKKITNDEILKLLIDVSIEKGYILSHAQFVVYCKNTFNIDIPKHFTTYRFGGSYKNLIKMVEDHTGLKYKPYFKSIEHKEKISNSAKGKKWWSCDVLEKSILCYTHDLTEEYEWYLGKKYGNKN